MKMNSGVETETERTCEEGGSGKTEADTLQGKPHARPYPTRGSIIVLFPILLYFRAVGCVCSRPEQLGNSGKSFVRQFSGAAQYRAKRVNYLLQSRPRASLTNFGNGGNRTALQMGTRRGGNRPLPGGRPEFRLGSVCLLNA